MKNKILLLLFLCVGLFSSCSLEKRLAYDFVKKTNGAYVAFYIPNELDISNIRKDCTDEALDSIAPENVQDTINARTKIVNKIDENLFLDILVASFENRIEDYGLSLVYWENEQTKPDSLHWIVDLSHIEIQELVEYMMTYCGDYSYEFYPSTTVNVASWFELINGDKSHMMFTEQDYCEYISDCEYVIDSLNNTRAKLTVQPLTIDGFYDFASMLGKLYAGYAYDFFMNDYVKKELLKKDKVYEYYDDYMYMRYDPYETYIYNAAHRDKLIPMEE